MPKRAGNPARAPRAGRAPQHPGETRQNREPLDLAPEATEPEPHVEPACEPKVPAARAAEPEIPQDPVVAALLGEISELRLSAATHLTVAAAAMDAGRPDIAAELIEAQQRDVARLRLRAEELLGVEGELAEQARRSVAQAAAVEESTLLATARTPATKSLRRTPRGAVAVLPRRTETHRASHWSATGVLLSVAIAVLVALVRPLAPHPHSPSPDQISASVVASLDANVSRSYDQLRQTAKPKTPRMDVVEATARLHADLQRLLPMAATDPQAARRVLEVLQAERKLLSDHAPDALTSYLPEAVRILTQLRSLATPNVLAILPPVEAVLPQSAAASDALPPAPKAAPAPTQPTSSSDNGGSDGSQTSTTASGGGTGESAAPAPVVQLPDVPQLPSTAPDPGTSGGGTGSTDSNPTGTTGSTEQPSTGGPDPSSIQLPKLPAPLVVDPATN